MHDVQVPSATTDLIRAVYERSGARLWRSVRAFSGSTDVADEAVAEAFAQALRRGNALRDPEAWVRRTAFLIAKGDLARRRGSVGGDDQRELAAIATRDPAFHEMPGNYVLERVVSLTDGSGQVTLRVQLDVPEQQP